MNAHATTLPTARTRQRRSLGAALRERAERNFSWNAFGARLEALYAALLAPAARRRWPLLSRVN